jgi:alanine racemase
MVKADAYGIGMVPVAAALARHLRERLAGFGVAAVAEGEALRVAGWTGRIVVFTPPPPGEFERAAEADLTLALSTTASVARWAAVAETAGRVLAFHAEIDTGMGRAGFPLRELGRWAPEVAALGSGRLRWEGCFTHFHSADEPDLAPTAEQWSRFRGAVDALRSDGGFPSAALLHVANSAAAMRCSFPGDWVRPGIFLYGGRVGAEPPEPVASVRARVVLLRTVEAGATLGYGATYRARRDGERWATLAIGYGDGLPRAISPAGGEALIRGRRVPIVGRISMDMTVVEVTAFPEVQEGDVATLIGRDGGQEITVDAVARQAGTISYEILTGLTSRLPRVYQGAAVHAGADLFSAGDQ